VPQRSRFEAQQVDLRRSESKWRVIELAECVAWHEDTSTSDADCQADHSRIAIAKKHDDICHVSDGLIARGYDRSTN
jgi:hypothetical protein